MRRPAIKDIPHINTKGGLLGRPCNDKLDSYFVPEPPMPFSLSLAWAAASRAIGTR